MTKCKPPIFGDSAVLKKGLWVTLVIALVLALYGALFTPTWQTRAFTIDAAAQTHLHPLTDGESFTLPLPDGGICEIGLPVTALSSESGGTATLILTRQGLPIFTQTVLLTDSIIRENLTFSFEPVDADKLVLTFSGNTLPALGMSGGNQLCIRLSGTRPSCAMLYYGIFAAVLVLFCAWESLFTARCAAAGRQNHLLRLQADVRRYGFLIEQLVRRNFNTKYRQSILGVLWSFLNPLLTMLVQYLVFSTPLRYRPLPGVPDFGYHRFQLLHRVRHAGHGRDCHERVAHHKGRDSEADFPVQPRAVKPYQLPDFAAAAASADAADGGAGVARAAAAAADDCAFVSVCAGRDAGDGDAERFLPRYAIPVERDFALVDVCDADFLSGYNLAGGASGDFPFEPDVSAD